MSVALIASNTMFGYYSKVLLSSMIEDKVHATFVRRLNFAELEEYVTDETTTVIIIGHPYANSQESSLREVLTKLDIDGNIPFTQLIHVCNWGDTIKLPGVVSIVEEETSVTKALSDYIATGSSIFGETEMNVGARKLVNHLESYHQYDFMHHRTSQPLSLKLIADAYRGRVDQAVKLTDEGVTFDYGLRDSLHEQMEEYIYGAIDKVAVELVNGTIIAVLHAENYHNEIAHKIMSAYQQAGYQNVIVLIGKETRGDDMFHIRVSDNLDAESVAKHLNNGKGNKHASTVFLGKHRQAEINIIKAKMANYL